MPYMGLLDFVKFADPFKVKVGERTLAEGEVPSLTKTTDMVVVSSNQTMRLVSYTNVDEIKEHSGKNKRKVGFSVVPPPVKKARTGGISIFELVATIAGKSLTVLKKLELQSGQPGAGGESVSHPTEELVSSFITPTLDHEVHEDSGSTQDGSIQTRRVSYYVVLTSSSEHDDVNVVASPKTTSPKPHAEAEVENVIAGFVDRARGTSDPGNKARTSSIPRNETGFSSFVPNDAGFEIDADIASLRDRLGKAKTEAADAAGLHKQILELKAVAYTKLA
ncbi:hypothetical protein Tco_1041855 [Tanacetum coccineum]|uniref:Uncharacterized protein n=1 Tax=Tanacetum coccineum TaxID=301880 RepID=A0ABQ5GHX7_9ASTR